MFETLKSIEEKLTLLEKLNLPIMDNDILQVVDNYNNSIHDYISKLSNYYNNIKLERFNFDEYYDKKLVPLKYKGYIALEKPNEIKLRKQLHCINNERFFK